MDWRHWRRIASSASSAAEIPLCSINPDAHGKEALAFVRAGINSARKGWLTRDNVLNCRPLPEVKEWLGRRKKPECPFTNTTARITTGSTSSSPRRWPRAGPCRGALTIPALGWRRFPPRSRWSGKAGGKRRTRSPEPATGRRISWPAQDRGGGWVRWRGGFPGLDENDPRAMGPDDAADGGAHGRKPRRDGGGGEEARGRGGPTPSRSRIRFEADDGPWTMVHPARRSGPEGRVRRGAPARDPKILRLPALTLKPHPAAQAAATAQTGFMHEQFGRVESSWKGLRLPGHGCRPGHLPGAFSSNSGPRSQLPARTPARPTARARNTIRPSTPGHEYNPPFLSCRETVSWARRCPDHRGTAPANLDPWNPVVLPEIVHIDVRPAVVDQAALNHRVRRRLDLLLRNRPAKQFQLFHPIGGVSAIWSPQTMRNFFLRRAERILRDKCRRSSSRTRGRRRISGRRPALGRSSRDHSKVRDARERAETVHRACPSLAPPASR